MQQNDIPYLYPSTSNERMLEWKETLWSSRLHMLIKPVDLLMHQRRLSLNIYLLRIRALEIPNETIVLIKAMAVNLPAKILQAYMTPFSG